MLNAFPLPKIGPLIISEQTRRPWRENYYARAWREVASAAGVPDKIFSMDSRAGAISEAERAAGLDAAQKMAAHKNPAMTRKYVRNSDLAIIAM